MQLHSTRLAGPDFLEAVAEAERANGNDINAAEYARRAREWRADLAQRDHCHGCYPGLVAEFATTKQRLADAERLLHSARAVLSE